MKDTSSSVYTELPSYITPWMVMNGWRIQLVMDVLTHHIPRNNNWMRELCLMNVNCTMLWHKWNKIKLKSLKIEKMQEGILSGSKRAKFGSSLMWEILRISRGCVQSRGGKLKMGFLWKVPIFKKWKIFLRLPLIKALIVMTKSC